MRGYEELRGSAAWIDLSARGRLRITGGDRKRLLHAMTTQDVQNMAVGQTVYTFFLNAQGRVLADAYILCREEDLLLDLEPEVREKIARHIDKYIIADDATFEDITTATACIAIEGPAPEPRPKGAVMIEASACGSGGYRVILPAEQRDAFAASLGLPEADAEALRTVRLENGVPRYGDDITESHIALETQQMHAIHFNKGCYLGQEIVERVRSRGALHKKIMALAIVGDSVPDPQTEVQSNGEKAGILYSAAYSPAEGRVRALALMRVDFVERNRPLEVNGAPAQVVQIRAAANVPAAPGS